MNKRQELDIMILKAKLHMEKTMEQHNQNWHSKEAREEGAPKSFEVEGDEPVVEE